MKKEAKPKLAKFADLNLETLWQAHLCGHSAWDHPVFLETLRGLTSEPEMVDMVGFCADCAAPDLEDDLHSTNGGHGDVCETCIESYSWCERCEEQSRNVRSTLADDTVCQSCLDDQYSWCDHCEGYFQDGNEEHSHEEDNDDGCDCESPAQSFTVRNDGEPPLANDTRTTITLPAGVISDEGLYEIANYLRNHSRDLEPEEDRETMWGLSYRLGDLGETWQTKQGNFTKRLSRLAYKELGLKIAPDVVSKVGCIARDHSTAVDFQIETTRNLNLDPEEFGHEESCWWQSYFLSRCTLKSHGGFGLRTFDPRAGYVSGRAWVLPMRETEGGDLTPTFETREPSAFVVFNGYGTLSGYVAARIMSHMAGMTYRKFGFSCSPMYVNGESAYLIAPEEIATRYTDGFLNLEVDPHANLFHTEKETSHAALF